MTTPTDTRNDDVEVPARSTGWVARRLGVSPSTLRTWHRRYGVGPTGRSAGGHGRYRAQDLERLERMHRLIVSGVSTGEAARVSADPRTAPPPVPRTAGRRRGALPGRGAGVPDLSGAARLLDQPLVERLIVDALDRDGVVATWNELVVPVLTGIGDDHARHGGCIDVEHLFSGSVQAVLTTRSRTPRRTDGHPPILLACPDGEQHSLPLAALGAALAEIGCPARVLGASVPAAAVADAIRRIGPRAVFLWAQSPDTARTEDLTALGRRPVPVVLGGPGWRGAQPPPAVTRVDSLGDALRAVSGGVLSPLG